nr:hypothetical protein [Rhodoferax sp.]
MNDAIERIAHVNHFNATLYGVLLFRVIRAVLQGSFKHINQRDNGEPRLSLHIVAKHIEKEGLGEGVEVGQGLAALGSEGFGLIQDGGDAALLFQWRQWN